MTNTLATQLFVTHIDTTPENLAKLSSLLKDKKITDEKRLGLLKSYYTSIFKTNRYKSEPKIIKNIIIETIINSFKDIKKLDPIKLSPWLHNYIMAAENHSHKIIEPLCFCITTFDLLDEYISNKIRYNAQPEAKIMEKLTSHIEVAIFPYDMFQKYIEIFQLDAISLKAMLSHWYTINQEKIHTEIFSSRLLDTYLSIIPKQETKQFPNNITIDITAISYLRELGAQYITKDRAQSAYIEINIKTGTIKKVLALLMESGYPIPYTLEEIWNLRPEEIENIFYCIEGIC